MDEVSPRSAFAIQVALAEGLLAEVVNAISIPPFVATKRKPELILVYMYIVVARRAGAKGMVLGKAAAPHPHLDGEEA